MNSEQQPPVRDHIFISYRRDDARGASGRLYDWTRIAFGRDHVFRDVHSTGVGKWRDKIDAALAQSAVCVAVIGPRWASAENLPRLHDPSDMVRHELVAALASEALTLVPTMVEGAEVPKTADLPVVLRPLFDIWNARRVTEEAWEDDIRRLIVEIVEATGLPVGPDLDDLLHDAYAAHQRVTELEQMSQLQADQIEALRRTVDELRTKVAEASATWRPAFAAAFSALAQGDSLPAEEAFERDYATQHRAGDESPRAMAEAARHVANLALLRDVAKAVSFYRKACAADPDNVETARLLGHALMLLGELEGAEAAFLASLRAAREQHDPWGEMAAHLGLGDVHWATGDLSAANAAFSAALHTAQQRLAAEPANKQWQFSFSVSQERIGNVLRSNGDWSGALGAYSRALAIRQEIASADPGNTRLQLALAVSHDSVGTLLKDHADLPSALAAFRNSLTIREALATRDAANTEWQYHLSEIHERIGDTLMVLGDRPAALTAYRESFKIAEALAACDRSNTTWQRNLSLVQLAMGGVLMAQNDAPRALVAYCQARAISEALTRRDPVNVEWQRDLAMSHIKIGDVMAVQPDGAKALTAYQEACKILEELASRDRTNTFLVGSSRVDLQACKLEYSIVSPK